MMFLLYPFYAAASIFITLFSCVFCNWWLPLFANAQGNLPKYLYWFQTFDNTLDAAIQGGLVPAAWANSKWKRYWARVYWLYRNPAYGFDYFLLGRDFNPSQCDLITFKQNESTIVFYCINGKRTYFNFYYSNSWCILKFGWKAWNSFNTETQAFSIGAWGTRIPVCFTIKFM